MAAPQTVAVAAVTVPAAIPTVQAAAAACGPMGSVKTAVQTDIIFHATNKDTQSPPSNMNGKALGPLPGVPRKRLPTSLLPHLSLTHDAFSVSHVKGDTSRQEIRAHCRC